MLINRSAWPHNRSTYDKLLGFIVAAAAEDFPDATRVRVSYLRSRTPSAADLRADKRSPDKEIRVRVRELEAAR